MQSATETTIHWRTRCELSTAVEEVGSGTPHRGRVMMRRRLSTGVNVGLLVAGVLTFLTGCVAAWIVRGPYSPHALAAYALLVLLIAHLILHSRALGAQVRRVVPRTGRAGFILRTAGLCGGVFVAASVPSLSLQAQPVPHCAPGQVPEFRDGFGDLKAQLGPVMGFPATCAHATPGGTEVLQFTTTGLARWESATNTPSFISGGNHWALTEHGLVHWSDQSADETISLLAPGTAGS